MKDAIRWLKRHDAYEDSVSIEVHDDGKNYYIPDENKIYISSGASDDSLVHEMGHALEHNNPRYLRAVDHYLNRVRRRDLPPLYGLTADIFGVYEVVLFKDEPIAPYIRRIYPQPEKKKLKDESPTLNIESTEVLSIGLQLTYINGIEWVYKKDPFLAALLTHLFPKLK